MVFSVDSPISHMSFGDSTCVLYLGILPKWIAEYMRLECHTEVVMLR